MTYQCTSTGCVVACIALFVGWTLLASGMLYFTWNKVIRAIAPVKAIKYPQALLFLATVIVLVGPACMMKRKYGHCGKGHCCSEMKGDDCPYSRKEKGGDGK